MVMIKIEASLQSLGLALIFLSALVNRVILSLSTFAYHFHFLGRMRLVKDFLK
jgi:hypothetical protein